MTHYLIIGNGAAGATAAETIRRHDPAGDITIVGAEPYPMYSRPGLAYVLINEIPAQQVFARQPAWYEALRLNLLFGRAEQLDAAAQGVWLAGGRFLPYDRLLIATGARAVPPPYPGADLTGVVYLDTFDSTQELLRQARRAKRAVVIGGGITALELSEGLAHRGVETHYFLRGGRLWSKVFNAAEGRLLEEKMRAHGVHIHKQTETAEILGDRHGRVRGVRLKSGDEFRCDLVGVAIGVKPQLDLVQGTPLAVDRAILVNEFMQSSVPNIYAAGDCAQVYDRWTGQHTLDMLWPSAVAEGNAAALNMVGQRCAYVKGSPFNACLIFGMHITAIGQVNPREEGDEVQDLQYLSRGSSEVWYSYPRAYDSAWSADGPNTVRLVADGDYLVGALIIGEQSLADPLRYLIENRVNVRPLEPYFQAGGATLKRRLQQFWHQLNPDQAAVPHI